jgi:hypothetical protein
VNVFVIELDNQPGELATLLERLAGADVNVILAAVPAGGTGTVSLIADDDPSAARALTAAGYRFSTTSAVKVRSQNRPGEGASVSRALATAGVNIELLLPLEITSEVAILVLGVDNLKKAELVLGERIVPD